MEMSTLDNSSDSRDNRIRKKVRLVLRKSSDFHEVRCDRCHRLLYKELIKSGSVEIKCPRCGQIKRSEVHETH